MGHHAVSASRRSGETTVIIETSAKQKTLILELQRDIVEAQNRLRLVMSGIALGVDLPMTAQLEVMSDGGITVNIPPDAVG